MRRIGVCVCVCNNLCYVWNLNLRSCYHIYEVREHISGSQSVLVDDLTRSCYAALLTAQATEMGVGQGVDRSTHESPWPIAYLVTVREK